MLVIRRPFPLSSVSTGEMSKNIVYEGINTLKWDVSTKDFYNCNWNSQDVDPAHTDKIKILKNYKSGDFFW